MQVVGEQEKTRIIEAIRESKAIYEFLESFFGWVNEFAEQHGEERFY